MDINDYLDSLEDDSSMLMNDSSVVASLQEYGKQLGELLKECIDDKLQLYYVQRYPVMYKRTYGLMDSLIVDDFVDMDIDSQSLTINLSFNDNLSWGNSLWNSSDGFKPILIDRGWAVSKNVWFKDVEHLGWQKGAYFIEDGIKEFKMEINDPDVHVYLDGEEV